MGTPATLRSLDQRGSIQRNSLNCLPTRANRPCRIGFFTNLATPQRGMAWEEFDTNPEMGCVGRLYFEVPGCIQYGRYFLNVSLRHGEIVAPMAIMTKEELKAVKAQVKASRKQQKQNAKEEKNANGGALFAVLRWARDNDVASMRIGRCLSSLAAAALITAATTGARAAQADEPDFLRQRVEHLLLDPAPRIDGVPIAATVLIGELYQRRGFSPLWSRAEDIQALYRVVLKAADHGLNPADYHASQLAERLHADAPGTPISDADTEIVCTDALARLVFNLMFGKLDPADLEPTWNFSREIEAGDPVEAFSEIIESGDLEAEVDRLAPQLSFYRWLKRALAEYRSILDAGGWPLVPDGPTLKPDFNGPRVAALRARLEVTGDAGPLETPDPFRFDDDLAAAVVRFQSRHGLDPDGKVGPLTLDELNVPVEARIDQIRASLERVRWVFRDIRSNFILVDIAGYHLYLVKQSEPLWSTRIQVGKPYHETPVFKAEMRYLVFNPTWTVPPGILKNEVMPAVRKDPSYLLDNSMSVIASDGRIIDPASIDWSATVGGGFPYMVRQEPGPKNALGRVKFMFPNQYMVYLHDTPSKAVFERAARATSHGCIRVENPLNLAELLLEDKPGWDRARIDRILASGTTTTVNLPEPLTVMLLYWTAEADRNGTVFFRRDLYGRDARVIEHLDEPYRASPPRRRVD